MYMFISVLILLASVLLIFIVLVQNSKGGGLASNFSSSNQVMGVRKTTDFLEKATWTLAGFVMFFAIIVVMSLKPERQTQSTGIEKQLEKMQNSQPAAPDFEMANPQNNPSENQPQE